MAHIVLSTINARYIHSCIGLRWIFANLGELQQTAELMEFSLTDPPSDIAEKILAANPKIVGLGVYIWNATQISNLVQILKRVRPEIQIILGGPEVSHLPLRVDFSTTDYLIAGEGEVAFYQLCQQLLHGSPPATRTINAQPVDINSLNQPYSLYTEEDLAHRLIYFEASRGCPFTCEFCLSSQDKRVRPLATAQVIEQLEYLWQRGARTIKFVDRTFNSNITTAVQILDFFLAKKPPFHVHFEVIPEHFPQELQSRLQAFPPGTLQLEVGIQTLNKETAKNIRRNLNFPRIKENLAFLDQQTTAHLHVDLIIGLPGESMEQFADNLDTLASLSHGEIQLGILKKLSGTTINRHDQRFGMVYSATPPYEILQNNLISFARMQQLKRMARFWDLVYNSGNFQGTAPLLWPEGKVFSGFFAFSCWLYEQTRATWQIGLPRLTEFLFTFLVEKRGFSAEKVANALAADILVVKGRVLPAKVQAYATLLPETRKILGDSLTKRQRRHQNAPMQTGQRDKNR